MLRTLFNVVAYPVNAVRLNVALYRYFRKQDRKERAVAGVRVPCRGC